MTVGTLDTFAELHGDVEIPDWWSFDYLEYLHQYTKWVVNPWLDNGGVLYTGTKVNEVIVIDDPSDDERELGWSADEALAQENELDAYEMARLRRSERPPQPNRKYINK